MFILGRAIAGLGAAGIYQGALGIIGYTVVLNHRPLYFGVVVSSFAISACIGPVIGGALTDHVTWRWCFWMYVFPYTLVKTRFVTSLRSILIILIVTFR